MGAIVNMASLPAKIRSIDFAPEDASTLLGAIVTSTDEAILSKTLDGQIMSWNAASEKLFGYLPHEILGKSIRCLIPADRQNEEDDIIKRIAAGERIANYETVRLHKDGTPIDVAITISPVRDRAGVVVGASKIVRNISEKRKAEQKIHGLLREVNHRAKNLLGLAQAIAFQTQAKDIDDFRNRFSARLKTLADSQDLLIEGRWEGVQLDSLFKREFVTFGDIVGSRIRISGEPIVLRPDIVPMLGMVIHELTTNAAKHGALSSDSGSVDVKWTRNADQFELCWVESGGPAVVAPTETGYGTKVTSRMVEAALDGQITREYAPQGLRWCLRCQVSAIMPGSM